MNHAVTLSALDTEIVWVEGEPYLEVSSETNPFAMWEVNLENLKRDAIALREFLFEVGFLFEVEKMKALHESSC